MKVKEFYKITGEIDPPKELVRESDAMDFYNIHKERLLREGRLGHIVSEDILIFYTLYRNRYDEESLTKLEKAIRIYKQIEKAKQYCEQQNIMYCSANI